MMIIELEVYQAIGLMLTVVGSVVGVSKAFLSRIEDSIHERDKVLENTLNNLSKTVKVQTDEVRKVERDLLVLKAELPREYVAKDDFVRSFTVVEAKLDAVQTLIGNLKKEGS